MKIDDIKVGHWYTYKKYTPVVVIDLGTYETEHSNTAREISVSGVTVQLGYNWYGHSNLVKQRRAVVLMVNGNRANLSSVTAQQLTSQMSDDAVKNALAERYAHTEKNQIESRNASRVSDFQNALQGVLLQITGKGTTSSRSYYGNIRATLLANEDVVDQMVLLWLRYNQQCNKDINGESDIESLVDTYRDAARGLKSSATHTDFDVLRQKGLEKVEAEWNTQFTVKEITA